MALIICPECEKKISDTSNSCPSCGYSMEKFQFYKTVLDYFEELLKKCIGDSKIIKEYERLVLKQFIEEDGSISLFSFTFLYSFAPLLRKILTKENVEKISNTPEKTFEMLKKQLDVKVDVGYLESCMLYYLIKKNNLSKNAIDDYGNISKEGWLTKYSDVIQSITEQQFQELEFKVEFSTFCEIWKKRINSSFDTICSREWYYIFDKIFEILKPKEEDCFGAVEICEYIAENYDLKNDIRDVAGYICFWLGTGCKYTHMSKYSTRLELDDGRYIDYNSYYYKKNRDVEIKYEQDDIDRVESDVESELDKCILYAQREREDQDGAFFKNYNVTYDEVKQARELYLVDFQKSMESKKKIQNAQIRNKLVEELTEPIVDPNHLTGVKCPNCGRNSVKKISTFGRMFSVGLFGLSSSKVGKTMECSSCGYKW